MRTLQSNFRSRVHSFQLAVAMVVVAACAGVTRQPIRYTSLDESTITAVRVSSTERPMGATSEYTIEEVHLPAGRSLELRIGQTLNQSRVAAIN